MKPVENKREPSSSICDLNIIVEGKQYGAHWCILRKRSRFFDEFYRRKLKAKKSSDGTKSCVYLEGISSELVGLFLQYVYMNASTEHEKIELNEINNVLKFSVMFGLKDLEMAKSNNLEAPVQAIDESNRMSKLHKNLLKFLHLRTTGYKTGDLAKFVAHKAYIAANMECLFEVLKIVSCNGEKTIIRLKLLDILITMFSASLDQEVVEVDKRGNEETSKECKGCESKTLGTHDSGKSKSIPLLRVGLINGTANPRTGAKPKRSISHRENTIKRKIIFRQNSKKTTKIVTNGKGRQNRNNNSEYETNLVTTGKIQNNIHTCPKLKKTQHSPANRRIILIKEHLERINSRIGQNKSVQSDGETKRSENKSSHVHLQKDHINQDGRVENKDKHAHVLGGKEKILTCDTETIKEEKDEVVVANVNERKLEFGNEQEPRIMKKKVRKMWTKSQYNFPLIDDESAYNKIDLDENPRSTCKEKNPNQNSERQQLPRNCDEKTRKRIYISGGIQKNDYFAHKAILELNRESGSYTTRGAMYTGRYNHGMAQLGNEIFIVGGNSGFFEQLRSVESYSPELEQWNIKPSMREARDEFSLAVCDECLYAIGGHNGIQDLRSVEMYNTREKLWSFVSPMRNYRAGACTACFDDRSIFVIGGFNGQTYLTSVEQYDITADVWIEVQPINNKRAYSCTVHFERDIYIFGGFDGQVALSSCEMYDVDEGIWKILPDMNTPRMNATAVVYSGSVFVLGGECDSVFLETVEYYNMKNKTWTFVQRLPQPMAGLRACVFLDDTKTLKNSISGYKIIDI